jgi:hypothetical protein
MVAGIGKAHLTAVVTSAEVAAPRGTAAGSKKPITLRSSLATNVLARLILFCALFWNITTASEIRMSERLTPLGTLLGGVQIWDMFAPIHSRIMVRMLSLEHCKEVSKLI